MQLHPLVESAGISISYDCTNEWLYADWKGLHDQASSRAACLQLLECLRTQPCRKILNDNFHISHSSMRLTQWGSWWLNEMQKAGLQYIAWVLPQNILARQATETTVKSISNPVVATFDDLASACLWLQKAHEVPPVLHSTPGVLQAV
jgi:hypothetical protein